MNTDRRTKTPVALLGATGAVGQRFVSLLADHPWFELSALVLRPARQVSPLAEACRWILEPMPENVAGIDFSSSEEIPECRLIFSALGADVAGPLETRLAEAGRFVVSNARSHRMDSRVPLVVPEVNPDHLDLVAAQEWEGGLATNPNCSTIGLVLALKPLADAFGLRRVQVVTLQALSGAGLGGPSALSMTDNLVPVIPGEEEKLERETGKILGVLSPGRDAVEPHGAVVSAQCTRVPVLEGHTECISVELERDAETAEVIEALAAFRAAPQELLLPTAPERPLEVLAEEDRPQPRLDRNRGAGMTCSVGRVRPCGVLGHKLVALSHNTVRGAAGGSVLLAELAVARGAVEGVAAPRAA
ncbi:MAG: aspartate-semialdehyde dehydrogenase [Thermoanaerobaculia bacterium]